jgi:hypothetical protein
VNQSLNVVYELELKYLDFFLSFYWKWIEIFIFTFLFVLFFQTILLLNHIQKLEFWKAFTLSEKQMIL